MGSSPSGVLEFSCSVMRFEFAGAAAYRPPLPRLAILTGAVLTSVLLECGAGTPSAFASLGPDAAHIASVPRLDRRPSTRLTTVKGTEPRVRLAQANGGLLDSLLSVFSSKPKIRTQAPSTVEAPASQGRSLKSIPHKPQQSGAATNAEDGSDATFDATHPTAPRMHSYASERTMCVRLCDGYYWPVNSGTRSSSIARDRNVCEQSCQSETQLFIQHSLSADAGDMRDLSGKPYRKLKTAFLYRKSYHPECKCRPDPWSKPELMRHEEYRAAESGELVGDEAHPKANSGLDAGGTDGIADAALADGDANSTVELITGDEGGDEPVASETDGLVRNVSSSSSGTPIEAQLSTSRKRTLPKALAPVLMPAGAAAQRQADQADKPRNINARASR